MFRHINCEDEDCRTCLEDHLALLNRMKVSTNSNDDHLGKYAEWLKQNGMKHETRYGWATIEAMADENIERYITWYLG